MMVIRPGSFIDHWSTLLIRDYLATRISNFPRQVSQRFTNYESAVQLTTEYLLMCGASMRCKRWASASGGEVVVLRIDPEFSSKLYISLYWDALTLYHNVVHKCRFRFLFIQCYWLCVLALIPSNRNVKRHEDPDNEEIGFDICSLATTRHIKN